MVTVAPRPRFARPRRSVSAGYWHYDPEQSPSRSDFVPGYFMRNHTFLKKILIIKSRPGNIRLSRDGQTDNALAAQRTGIKHKVPWIPISRIKTGAQHYQRPDSEKLRNSQSLTRGLLETRFIIFPEKFQTSSGLIIRLSCLQQETQT